MDQIRPMNGPINLHSLEGFFVILCFSPTMGMVEGKSSKNGSKWPKMQENFTSDDFPRKHPIVIMFGTQV